MTSNETEPESLHLTSEAAKPVTNSCFYSRTCRVKLTYACSSSIQRVLDEFLHSCLYIYNDLSARDAVYAGIVDG